MSEFLLARAALPWNDSDMSYQQVIITGASSGFGMSFARRLAGECRCLVLVARRKEILDRLAAELSAAHPGLEVHAKACDLSAEGERAAFAQWLAGRQPVRTLLINNAGLGDHGDLLHSEPARNRSMVAVNVAALTELSRALLPTLAAAGGGIINIASLAGDLFIPDFAVYAASKAYVTSFSEALRLEMKEYGVPVLAVCPGPVHTGFGDVARRPGDGADSVPFKKCFYTPISTVVEGSLRALEHGKARYYPSTRIRVAAWFIRNMPLPLLRLVMSLRPRRAERKGGAA